MDLNELQVGDVGDGATFLCAGGKADKKRRERASETTRAQEDLDPPGSRVCTGG